MRAHNQHSETRRPSDRDRIVTTGPSRFQPARPEVLPEMMSVSVAGIQKNHCRTTIAERMVETRAELPFTGDQIGLFRAQPGRPALSALQFGAIHPHEFFLMHVLPKSFHRSAGTLIISITYNAISQNRSNCFLKPTIAIKTRKEPGKPGSIGGASCSSMERARSRVDRATGPRPARAPHPASACHPKGEA